MRCDSAARAAVSVSKRMDAESLTPRDPPSCSSTRSPCSGGSRPSPAPAPASTRGEIVLLRARTAPARPAAALCAGLLPVVRGTRPRARVTTCATHGARCAAGSACSGHANGLYRDLTVAENVRFWGATVGASDDEVAAAMERLGLDGRLRDVPVGKLSAGQRPAHRARLPRRPPRRAVAARRAPRRPRRRRAATSSTPCCARPSALGRDGDRRQPRARAGRRARRPAWSTVVGRPGRTEPAVAAMNALADRPAGGRQGPAHRAPQPGRHQPGAAVRRDRDADVRLRPRPTDERARAGRPRACLAGDAVQPARARPAGVRRRDRRRRARRAAGGGRRPGRRSSSARRWRSAAQLAVLEVLLGWSPPCCCTSRHPRRRARVAGRDTRPRDRLAWRASVRSTAASPPGSRSRDVAPAARCSRWWRRS